MTQTLGYNTAGEGDLVGMMGEFDDVTAVYRAAEKVRDAGYTQWDVHSPFPIHGIDKAIGIKPTLLPLLVLGGGVTGLLSAIVLEVFTMGIDYRYLISGKPYLSIPAFVPVMFELTVLLASFGAVFGMLLLNRLPMLYNPLLKSDRFARVTDDRFFIVISAQDKKFRNDGTASLLLDCGARAVEPVRD